MDTLLPELQTLTADDLSDRAGFDDHFLGVHLPMPSAGQVDSVLLPYTHFSILMRPDKRLAAITALGIDGSLLKEDSRSGTQWQVDPRLPQDQQTGERLYARNDVGRGRLVSRTSAGWGESRKEAAQANFDTFFYTNAAPQAAGSNQSLDLWVGLENYLLDNASDDGRRLVVFTGPIFSDTDPVHRGTEIPLQFFKVAAFLLEGQLAATGYVVDQAPQLKDMPELPESEVFDTPFPVGPFRTFQVPIRDIAALTGLNLGQLAAADRMPIASALPSAAVTSAWRELFSPECLDVDFELHG